MSGRLVVPDRDRLDCAESGGAVHEPPVTRKRHQDVVRELVLLDDVSWVDWRRLTAAPGEDLI